MKETERTQEEEKETEKKLRIVVKFESNRTDKDSRELSRVISDSTVPQIRIKVFIAREYNRTWTFSDHSDRMVACRMAL